MRKYKVFIETPLDYVSFLRNGINWLKTEDMILRARGIFIKPNLTYPKFEPGVTTTKEMLQAAIQVFTKLHHNVIIGESDGGYGSFDIEEAFENFGLHTMGQKYGAKVINLSRVPTVSHNFITPKGPVSIKLPKFLIEGDFITITIPVPKLHSMTGISLSYKNQWGCIPDMMRLRFHYYFNMIIGSLNSLLKVKLSIVDGTYGLTKSGPIVEGKAVQPGWLIMSQNLGAADRVVSHLMGLKLEDYPHYRYIQKEEVVPHLTEIELNQDLEPFLMRTPKFYLRRNFWNYLAMTTWYSRKWSYLVYESKLTSLIHKIMYTFRDRPAEFRKYKP